MTRECPECLVANPEASYKHWRHLPRVQWPAWMFRKGGKPDDSDIVTTAEGPAIGVEGYGPAWTPEAHVPFEPVAVIDITPMTFSEIDAIQAKVMTDPAYAAVGRAIRHGSDSPVHTCPECGRTSPTRAGIVAHQRRHKAVTDGV